MINPLILKITRSWLNLVRIFHSIWLQWSVPELACDLKGTNDTWWEFVGNSGKETLTLFLGTYVPELPQLPCKYEGNFCPRIESMWKSKKTQAQIKLPEPLVHTFIFTCSVSWEPRNNIPIKMSTSMTKSWFLTPFFNKRDGHWRTAKCRAELRMYELSLENLIVPESKNTPITNN